MAIRRYGAGVFVLVELGLAARFTAKVIILEHRTATGQHEDVADAIIDQGLENIVSSEHLNSLY
jgi:hypothetical protein